MIIVSEIHLCQHYMGLGKGTIEEMGLQTFLKTVRQTVSQPEIAV